MYAAAAIVLWLLAGEGDEPGATHDELAWKARTWRFLRFLFPAQ